MVDGKKTGEGQSGKAPQTPAQARPDAAPIPDAQVGSPRAPRAGSRKQAVGPEISSDSPNAMGSTVGHASNKGGK